MVEQYQGAVIAESQEVPSTDYVYYAPSQRGEYDRDTNNRRLSDGRIVRANAWFDEPLSRTGVDAEILDMM